MALYRKKPVVIEAVQFGYAEYGDDMAGWRCAELPEWMVAAIADKRLRYVFLSEDYWYFEIDTLEGKMLGGPDYWLIRGVQGELYPCKHAIFKETYEPASAGAAGHTTHPETEAE